MANNKYTEETKAQVMAALLAGQSVSEVAEAYKIPRGTVGRWSGEKQDVLNETDRNTKTEIGDLLLGYVKATLTALIKQQEVFADADWIRKQPANELAVLHGVGADKAIRLLEALATTEQAEEAT